MLWIRIRSPIFIMYSWCYENECLILIRCSYISVRFIFVSIVHIENFEHSSNHNAFSHTYWFQNILMTLAHLIIWHLFLFIHHIYYWFCHFSGYLNGHNHDFLVLCTTYVYAVSLLVCKINVLKINVRF